MSDIVVERVASDKLTSGMAPAGSYVEWAPILAGAAATLGVLIVLLAFGSAIGLSVVSPWSPAPITAKVIGGGMLWVILTQLWAFSLGGYISGRMRNRMAGVTNDEVHFRDGAHGLLVWSVAIVLGVFISSLALKTPTASGVETGNPSVTVALDRLFRVAQPSPTSVNFADTRAEAGRLLVASHDTGLSTGDRTYLSQLVVARTGIPPIDAEARVVTVNDQYNDSVKRTRRMTVVLAFLTAASLLIAAATAWWAAVIGGANRDEGIVWDGFSRNQRLWFMDERQGVKRF